MGKYCPNCCMRVSHKWFRKYIFCGDYCRKDFILKIQRMKIRKEFGDTPAKRRRLKKYANRNHTS